MAFQKQLATLSITREEETYLEHIGRIFKVIEIHRELLEPHRIRSRDSAKNT